MEYAVSRMKMPQVRDNRDRNLCNDQARDKYPQISMSGMPGFLINNRSQNQVGKDISMSLDDLMF